VIDKAKFLPEAKLLYLALDKKSKTGWDSMLPMHVHRILRAKRSIKGGFWRYWRTLGAAGDKQGASGYAKQRAVGITQALVDKEVVEHKSVVLWRENPTETATAFGQMGLEMPFGSMVFKPVRTQRHPPGTDRVLNWAAYGLWEDQLSHVLSDKEVADKKKLTAAAMRRYRATPKGKEAHGRYRALYNASEGGKETRRQYHASEGGKETKRKYYASEGGKETKRKSAARQGEQGDQGTKRARVLLETFDSR
jgi:hypothetical protein